MLSGMQLPASWPHQHAEHSLASRAHAAPSITISNGARRWRRRATMTSSLHVPAASSSGPSASCHAAASSSYASSVQCSCCLIKAAPLVAPDCQLGPAVEQP